MSDLAQDITLDEIKARLGDRWWRLNNLYYIINKEGKKVLFRMNDQQAYLHDNLHNANVIPKARQLGVTTFFSILFLDQILFSNNRTAGIICHRIEDQKRIFQNKIRFAWDNLHPWVKSYIGEPTADSAFELRFPNGGVIFTSMTTRSGTLQYLLVSEFGYICKHSPEKAKEIMTGALNSIDANQLIAIESTARGRSGYFYDLVMQADKNEKMGTDLTPLDWKMFFFPWWLDPSYKMEGKVVITDEMSEYFQRLKDKHGVELSQEQKSWYVKKQATQGENMFEEYPSTLEECFQVSLEGAYYAKNMDKVYTDGRVCPQPHDPMYPVDTWWDLGMDDFNVILFTQTVGPQIRFIDMYYNRNENLAHYVKHLEERGKTMNYRYGMHTFPHDIAVRELGTGDTRLETLWKLGMRNTRTGKKISINAGIDRVRTMFPKFYFDEKKCMKLVDALAEYRKEYDAKLGVFKDKPRHDETSHFADPVRLLACEWREHFPENEDKNTATSQSFF